MTLMVILALIILASVVSLLFISKRSRIIGIIILSATFLSLGLFATYHINHQFKQFYDMAFNNVSHHVSRLEHQAISIPLPPKTIFSFRFSDAGATYLTKTKKNEIIDFYDNIAEPNSFRVVKEKDETILPFKYHKEAFVIIIKKGTNSQTMYLTVDYYSSYDYYTKKAASNGRL